MPKRKTSRRPQPRTRKADSIDCLDKAADSCAKIAAIACLMADYTPTRALESNVLARLGGIVFGETQKIHSSLEILRRPK